VISGGDPIVTGALAAARVQDTSSPAVYSDLLIAQDYSKYLAEQTLAQAGVTQVHPGRRRVRRHSPAHARNRLLHFGHIPAGFVRDAA
jgi:hypothetical protein